MVAPVFLRAAAAVHVDDNHVLLEFQLGHLDVVARIDRRPMCADCPVQSLLIQWFFRVQGNTVFTSRQRFLGLGKFSGNIPYQGELGGFLQGVAFLAAVWDDLPWS